MVTDRQLQEAFNRGFEKRAKELGVDKRAFLQAVPMVARSIASMLPYLYGPLAVSKGAKLLAGSRLAAKSPTFSKGIKGIQNFANSPKLMNQAIWQGTTGLAASSVSQPVIDRIVPEVQNQSHQTSYDR